MRLLRALWHFVAWFYAHCMWGKYHPLDPQFTYYSLMSRRHQARFERFLEGE